MAAVTYKEKLNPVDKKSHLSPWLIWGLGAAFFFAEYYARVSPSVMVDDLMAAFNVNAFAIGGLSAIFYYAYISMQLPVGMLMDRYGPHRLLTLTALICGIGAFIFAYAANIGVADLGRLLMGFGAAFAFVGSLKLASIWFPIERFGLMAGLTQAIGMLGAATGEGPMAAIVAKIGWHHTMLLVGTIFLILAVAIGLIIRDVPAGHPLSRVGTKKHIGLLSSLKQVLTNSQSWYNALYAGLIYAPTAAFGELWGVNFLRQAYHINLERAALGIGFIFIGWGVGGPIAGWLSDRIQRRKPIMITSAIAGALILTMILYLPMPLWLAYVLLFCYGATNTGVAIAYAVASEINPRPISGTSMAFANMASVIIGALFQPLIGLLLVYQWGGLLLHGIPVYTLGSYRIALIILPICSLLGLVAVTKVRETYCKPIQPL